MVLADPFEHIYLWVAFKYGAGLVFLLLKIISHFDLVVDLLGASLDENVEVATVRKVHPDNLRLFITFVARNVMINDVILVCQQAEDDSLLILGIGIERPVERGKPTAILLLEVIFTLWVI